MTMSLPPPMWPTMPYNKIYNRGPTRPNNKIYNTGHSTRYDHIENNVGRNCDSATVHLNPSTSDTIPNTDTDQDNKICNTGLSMLDNNKIYNKVHNPGPDTISVDVCQDQASATEVMHNSMGPSRSKEGEGVLQAQGVPGVQAQGVLQAQGVPGVQAQGVPALPQGVLELFKSLVEIKTGTKPTKFWLARTRRRWMKGAKVMMKCARTQSRSLTWRGGS